MDVIQFLVLFEPTMALRFGTRKKLDAVLDLKQMFKVMATMPQTGIVKDSDWVDVQQIQSFDSLYSEVYFISFLCKLYVSLQILDMVNFVFQQKDSYIGCAVNFQISRCTSLTPTCCK